MIKINGNLFLTSDTHFGHRRLVDWGRPENFNELIIENWNQVVGKYDTVLHLGDLTMTNKEQTEEYVKNLNGEKYLILGNHDDRTVSWFSWMGFIVINPIFRLHHTKYDEWVRLLFTHEPEHNLPKGWFNIHGHLHGRTNQDHPEAKYHFDVGVDCYNFKPVRLGDILSKIESTHDERIG